MALLWLAAHAVTVLLARYGRRSVLHWAVAAAAGAVLVAPLAALSAGQRGALGPIPRPGLRDVWALFHDYFGGTVAAAALLAACAVIALLPPFGWWRRPGGVAASGPPAGTGTAAQAGTAAPAALAAEAGLVPGEAGPPAPAGPRRAAGLVPGEPRSPWWSRGGVSLPSVALPLL